MDVVIERGCCSIIWGGQSRLFYETYAKTVLRLRRMPFAIEAPGDPFYSSSNMSQLKKSEQQICDGSVVVKTMEELEAMADE